MINPINFNILYSETCMKQMVQKTKHTLPFSDYLVLAWLIFDFLIHSILEGSFVYISLTTGVRNSESIFAIPCKFFLERNIILKREGIWKSRFVLVGCRSHNCCCGIVSNDGEKEYLFVRLTATLDSLLCLILIYAVCIEKSNE